MKQTQQSRSVKQFQTIKPQPQKGYQPKFTNTQERKMQTMKKNTVQYGS